MAERPRESSAILKRRVNLRLDSKLKGYVSRQYLWTVRSYATTLPLEIFTQRNFVADFIQLKLYLIKKIAFWATRWGT